MRRRSLVRVARLTVVAAGAAAVAACGDVRISTGPRPVSTRVYLLQSVDGEPLPWVQLASGGDSVIVLNQTLTLGTGGLATRATTVRRVQGGAVGTITTQTADYGYVASRGAITIVPICGPTAFCVQEEAGSISDAELTLTMLDVPEAPVLRYTRALLP